MNESLDAAQPPSDTTRSDTRVSEESKVSDRDSARKPTTKKKAKAAKRVGKRKSKRKAATGSHRSSAQQAKFPRHPIDKALRIPRAVLEQNAGQPCTEKDAAAYVGVGYGGPFRLEVSSGLKYGVLERPAPGQVGLTGRARQILRPQRPEDELAGIRAAVLGAPDISEVYKHFRGENLPDPQFLRNALTDKFNIPEDKVVEFEAIFVASLETAKLLEEHGGKRRIIDASTDGGTPAEADRLRKLGKEVSVSSTDTCFVMMPFAEPIGRYYTTIYEPAIQKAGLTPVRADAEIFGAGKIMDQIWRGITSAKVLVAELTSRNPNVFYELGLAHALDKPVVLVCSNEEDVPFDLHHIRVIYYDVFDPFWGNKLVDKLAENILSAIKNPEEAVFRRALDSPAATETG